ncbi:MAG: hypothetical protein KF745_00445 [Phycisphaeraceae bacterium]|nr:hypothetical protein [Phycisphaeraceae bacterium]
MSRAHLLVVCCGLAIFTGAPLAAAMPSERAPSAVSDDLPSVDDVLGKAMAAAGGQDAIDKIETIHTKATFGLNPQNVEIETYWSRSGGRLTIAKMEFGDVIRGTDGKTPWIKTPVGYVLATTPEDVQQINGSAGMHMMMIDPKSFVKEELSRIAVAGTANFNGRECYKLAYTKKTGQDGTMFFDKETALPVGFEQTQRVGTTTITLEDWKTINGVKFFHLIKMNSPTARTASGERVEGTSEIKMTLVEVNNVDPKVFELPDEVKSASTDKADGVEKPKAAAAPQIKLEDLTPEHQAEAKEMLENISKAPIDTIRKSLVGIETGVSFMPEGPDKKKLQYVAQELKAELAKRGG